MKVFRFVLPVVTLGFIVALLLSAVIGRLSAQRMLCCSTDAQCNPAAPKAAIVCTTRALTQDIATYEVAAKIISDREGK